MASKIDWTSKIRMSDYYKEDEESVQPSIDWTSKISPLEPTIYEPTPSLSKLPPKSYVSQISSGTKQLNLGTLFKSEAPAWQKALLSPLAAVGTVGHYLGGDLESDTGKVSGSKLTGSILESARSAATGGAYEPRDMSTGNKFIDITAGIVGGGLGMISNPTAYTGLSKIGGVAEKALKTPGALGNIGRSAIRGAAEMGTLEGIESGLKGEDLKDTALNIGKGALTGAAFGGGARVLGEGAKFLKDNAIKTNITESKYTPLSPSGVLSPRTAETTPTSTIGIPEIKKPPTTQYARMETPGQTTMDLGLPKLEDTAILKESKLPKSFQKSEFVSSEVKKALEDTPEKFYAPDTNKRQWKDATEAVEKDFQGTLSNIMSKEKFDSADDVAQGFALMDRLQKDGDIDSAVALAESMIPKSRSLGQAVQAHSIIGRLSPEGVLQYTIRQYEKANEALPIGKKIKLTNEKAQKLADASREIQEMPEGRNKEIQKALLEKQINDDIPVSIAQKISTVQAMSHLLNIDTALRGILGNTTFNAAETISNLYALPYDRAISTITGKKTIGFPSLKTFGKGFVQGGKESAQEVKFGINLGDTGKYNIPKQTFKGTGGIVDKTLSKLEKALNYTLKVPDEAFKRGVVEDSLNQQMKLAGVKTPTKEMIDQANSEALFRTFQDNSLPAQIFQGAKDLLNKIGIGKTVQGSSGMKTKEFGVGDLVIKYTKVPGNIIARTVEYSPLGYLKTLSILHDAKVSGKLNQRDLSMTLGRASNGTIMIGMGALMYKLGLLESEDKDKDARELDRAAGLGNYKLNISALNRMFDSGNYTKQELKSGDTLASYNWLQPVSTAFAVGAAIDKRLKEKDKTEKSLFNKLKTGVATGLEEVLDIPTLTVIQSMFYEAQKKDSSAIDILSVPVKESIPGFIPSQVRQIAQTLDPIYRETKGDTALETFANKLKANIPSVREELRPKITPSGETKENQLPLFNLLSPAQVTKYKPLEITSKLKQLEESTGETNFYPNSTAPNSFKYKNKSIVLTQDEKSEFLKTLGKETIQSYNKVLYNKDIETSSDKSKEDFVKYLNSRKSEAYEKAKMELLKSRGIR